MPLVTQQGKVADRLRRFFKLRGRAGTSVDEVVVPTAPITQLNLPPWRLNEFEFLAWKNIGAIGAGRYNKVGIYMPVPRLAGVAVIKAIVLNNSDAAATHEYTIGYYDSPAVGLANFAQSAAYDTEDWTRTAGGVAAQLPPLIFTGDDAATLTPILMAIRVPADATVVFPVSIGLRAGLSGGPQGIRALVVNDTTPNTAMAVGFQGVFYPDAE